MQQDVRREHRLRVTVTRRDDPLLSALVTIGTVVGLTWFQRWWVFHVMPRVGTDWPQSRWWILQLIVLMGGYVVFAIVLLLWGRTPGRRVPAATCPLLTGLYVFGLAKVFEHLVLIGEGAISQTRLEVYAWPSLLVVPTGIALAWGVARRHGTLWVLGLLVARALAAAAHELQLHSGWWGRTRGVESRRGLDGGRGHLRGTRGARGRRVLAARRRDHPSYGVGTRA